jgi:hypothetical protein
VINTSERRVEVTRTYIVHLFCACGGEMLPMGLALPVLPPRYIHRCQVCGKRAEPLRTYPFVDYEWGNEGEVST